MATITLKSLNGSGRTEEDFDPPSESTSLQIGYNPEFLWRRTRNTGPLSGPVLPPHWRGLCWSYAVTSVLCGVWLGRSSSFSPVRRAWAKPSPTSTAMTPARQNAAIAHHKAMAAIRLKP